MTGGGGGGGRRWSWRMVNNRRWRASCQLTYAQCWWHSFWFLAGFNSIAPLGKMIQWYLGSSSFFLIIDDVVALDFVLNGCCNLHALFYLHSDPKPQKTNSASWNKESPLVIFCVVDLFCSSVCSSSSCLCPSLGLQFHQVFISKALRLQSNSPVR